MTFDRGPFVTIDEVGSVLHELLLPRASEIESIRMWHSPRRLVKVRYKDGSLQKWKFQPYKPSDGTGGNWCLLQ